MWTCPKCNEQLEDQFDSCWRCAQEKYQSALETRLDVWEQPVETHSCAKCGSHKIIPRARILDRGEAPYELMTFVEEEPYSFLFPGRVYSSLRATICGNCGYTEIWAANPHKLYEAYLKGLAGL
jgi:hypothetical protein